MVELIVPRVGVTVKEVTIVEWLVDYGTPVTPEPPHLTGGNGVRVNAILPRARTRLTEVIGGKPVEVLQPKDGKFDRWHPGNVSPFVVYLASPACELSGEVFLVGGSLVQRVKPWALDEDWKINGEGRLTVEGLAKEIATLGAPARGKGVWNGLLTLLEVLGLFRTVRTVSRLLSSRHND
jgi:hypothetical protein